MIQYLFEPGDVLTVEKQAIYMETGQRTYVQDFDDFEFDSDHVYIPIGSVEYVQRYAAIRSIILPLSISYPASLMKYLKRDMRTGLFHQVPADWFCKPVAIKSFTGDIKNRITETVDDNEMVNYCEPVQVQEEFRFYILDGEILGYSRYDEFETDQPPPVEVVNQMIDDFVEQPNGCSIDVGYVDGSVSLIECNDAWSLGYYTWGNMSRSDYVRLVTDRWKFIENEQSN